MDERRRDLNTRIDAVRAEQNKLSSQIEEAAKAGKAGEPEFAELREKSSALKSELKERSRRRSLTMHLQCSKSTTWG